jgi:hypothetical protein
VPEQAVVPVSELVTTLSYAADLGLGQPLAHCMRNTNVYCHADAAEQAEWFGDDIAFKAESFHALDMSTVQAVAALLRLTAGSGSGRDRVRCGRPTSSGTVPGCRTGCAAGRSPCPPG